MKTSLEWLTDFLPGPLTAEQAGEALTHGGLPVEVFEKHGNDTVIDVEVTSNRSDCLSHIGVARELSALLNREFKSSEPAVKESGTTVASVTSVAIEAKNLCPHYTARVIRGVKVRPSPDWMKRRLEAIGVRAINNIVDVTNYVMFEMGQPLHAFDFAKLDGRKIIVRNARANESIVSIDGHERKLTPDMLVIADATRPVALAGVMGGRDSEVSEQTADVLLESARFDPLCIRTTARRLAMKSDSSYRFERGIDPTLPLRASLRAAQLILEIAGGELLQGVAVAGSDTTPPRSILLRRERIKRLLGIDVPLAQVVESLNRLKLSPTVEGDGVRVIAPGWRADLNIEADLIEEVARIIGYEKIPVQEQVQIRLTQPDKRLAATDLVRSTMSGSGFYEAITVTFVSDAIRDDFKPVDVKLPRADASVRRADAHLRPSMLPGLLEGVRRNEFAGNANARFFEIGSTFRLDAKNQVVETRTLGLVGDEDLRRMRGAVELLLNRLDATREVRVVPDSHAGFSADACGRIEWGGKAIGWIGKLDRSIADKLDLRSAPAIAEVDMSALVAGFQPVPQLRPLPRFPAMRRDLSLVVPEATAFETLEKLVARAAPENLESLEYVGVYRGKPLEKGTKSQTISLLFRSPNETLTSQAVDAAVKKVTDAAERDGFKLRD